MSGKIEISREMAERIAKACAFTLPELDYQELRATLAAPVVERQADAELLVEFFEHGPMATINWFTPSSFEHGATKLYTSPPAPVEVVLPERMTREQATGLSDYPPEVCMYWWNACLDKVKELNQ